MERKATLRLFFIPDDLIIEVLFRLPVKSVLRFKCVCKSWRSLITDPQFAKSHFDVAAAPTHRLLHFRSHYEVDSLDTEAPLHDDSAKVGFKIPRPTRSPKYRSRPSIVGSCRGFILLQTDFFSFMIWNPSTGLHMVVDASTMEVGLMRARLCGIGYDSSADDYLVVVVTRKVVECFYVRTNSWSIVSEGTVPYYYPDFDLIHGEFLNGTLHWLVESHDHLHVIIAFDVREKRLLKIPLPHDIATAPKDYAMYPLRVMGGCLCFCFINCETAMLETWTMKEYKVQSSWTKSFVLPTYRGPFVSLCFTKNGEILGTDGRMLARFNDKGEFLENRTYEQYSFIFDLTRYGMYRESLLSLPDNFEKPSGRSTTLTIHKKNNILQYFSPFYCYSIRIIENVKSFAEFVIHGFIYSLVYAVLSPFLVNSTS